MTLIFNLLMSLVIFSNTGDKDNQPSTFVFPAFKHSYGIRKAGPTQLFLFMGFKVRFDNPQGLACIRLDSWEDENDPHDDDELTVYGVNSGENNIIYNRSMWSLGVYGLNERGNETLKEPHGICANSRGDVYVADSGNHRIVRLFNDGEQLTYVSAFGQRGTAQGEFEYPVQVALGNSGIVYVSDTGNNRIQAFDSAGAFLWSLGDSPDLNQPRGIAVVDSGERFRHRQHGFVIVVDSADSRIHKFGLNQTWLKTVRMQDFGFEQSKLEYACLDYYDQLILTDSFNHCLHKFTHDLRYITSFGERGDDENQFIEPRGIAIYRRFGQLFVAERSGAQYYWIGTDILDLQSAQRGNHAEFSFLITEPSYVTVDIVDRDGGLIACLANQRPYYQSGRYKVFWNGKKVDYPENYLQKRNISLSQIRMTGNTMPADEYLIKTTAEATYSSRTYFRKIKEYRLEYYPDSE